MKKTGILNRDLARVVASLGHGDILLVGDAGLPVPPGVPCIDLAVTLGVPGFRQVVEAVLSEMCIEAAFVADGMPEVLRGLYGVTPEVVSHDELKARSTRAVAVVRTGEATPYANVGLVAGVVF